MHVPLMNKLLQLVGAVLYVLASSGPVDAGISPADYRAIGVTVPTGAAVPLSAVVTDENGRERTIGNVIRRPAVLIFADYTCRTLCGPAVAFATDALANSGLDKRDFQLIVLGLNPHDTREEAERMRRKHLADAATDAEFLTADAASVTAMTTALG